MRKVFGQRFLMFLMQIIIGNGEQLFVEQWFVVVSRLPVALTLLLCMRAFRILYYPLSLRAHFMFVFLN